MGKADKRGEPEEIARLAKRYMELTLTFEETRRGDYRKSELEIADRRMVEARHRLFDCLLWYREDKTTPPPPHGGAQGREE